jgi:hypothetical protein
MSAIVLTRIRCLFSDDWTRRLIHEANALAPPSATRIVSANPEVAHRPEPPWDMPASGSFLRGRFIVSRSR